MGTQTEVHLGQTAAENCLVVTVDLTVTVDVTIVAVAYLCSRLILVKTLGLCQSVQLVEL